MTVRILNETSSNHSSTRLFHDPVVLAHLRENGIRLMKTGRSDAVLLDSRTGLDNFHYRRGDLPVILSAAGDSADIRRRPNIMSRKKQVRALLKGYWFEPKKLHFEPAPDGRYFVQLALGYTGPMEKQAPPAVEKLVPGHEFGSFPTMAPWIGVKLPNRRPVRSMVWLIVVSRGWGCRRRGRSRRLAARARRDQRLR